MTTVTFKGTPVRIDGHFPQKDEQAPAFSLVSNTLDEVSLSSLSGLRKVINIFPSIDTPTCATSVRKFNEKASALKNARVLCISADLPFAQARFCGAEGLERVLMLSTMRDPDFFQDYGV
ncbi:MAG: thiol peroxidase, partial [Gammaproteobacteria bacterium]|nr:thiol peroxidase [Gammaproteobacteria bacterium]